MRIKKQVYLTLILAGWIIHGEACTIFSAKDKNGHVWAGNNEDMVFTFHTYLNLVTSTDSTFGYAFFTFGELNDNIQGGVNEAGLFFDANAVKPSKYKDYEKKKDFPGGANALTHYIFKKCQTVPEVMNLLKKYRLPGLESGQLHFADKYGNLGIVVADSMWITKSNYQISTNYNLCHRNKDKVICWRFPIAERILKSQEPGLNSFREICDSTSQKKGGSTIYSNIHNLTTGDIWFYYGMDYTRPYKTNIKELLKKGNTSFLMYELFMDVPLVAVYKTYQSQGAEASLKKLDEYQLSISRRNEILRLLFSDLIIWNHDFNGYPFLSDFIQSKNEDLMLPQALKGITLFCTGKKSEALDVLNKYMTLHPKHEGKHDLLVLRRQMQGNFKKRANIKFELKGYENARYIFVEGLTYPNLKYFLVQKEGKWFGKFKLDPDEYHYIFSVDGKRVLDPENSDIVKEGNLEYNRVFIKK